MAIVRKNGVADVPKIGVADVTKIGVADVRVGILTQSKRGQAFVGLPSIYTNGHLDCHRYIQMETWGCRHLVSRNVSTVVENEDSSMSDTSPAQSVSEVPHQYARVRSD